MTRYYIDTSTNNDFDAVIRFLHSTQIPIGDRNKLKLMVSAELTDAQLEELQRLPLEEPLSIGTTPLG